ncbi:MAG: argininosuccinate lyase [Anaerolineales bacterium]|nr:argininosuccinate lyase [Anaerolineales bacterium]
MPLWSGRFTGNMNPTAWDLNTSLPFDQRLAAQDVQGSVAWAGALLGVGVLTPEEHAQIVSGLEAIVTEFAEATFTFEPSDEDIHTAVERRLGALIGPLAGKLHTGRSRNDQVATDFRLWMLEAIPQVDTAIQSLQTTLVQRAEADLDVIMPGYTHLQRAQPILLSHWWLSFFWPLQRDRERLAQLAARTAVFPLGCGALAGTAFPVDRAGLAAALGFSHPAQNSLDAVSDRDFVVEFLFIAATAGVHLSKLAEAVILFTTAEFGFFTLSDAYSTGSSLMPQKKNPDVFELTRGKAGTLVGLLTGMLATLKGLPSTYDKDLQEDKVPVFQATDTLLALLPVLAGALDTITLHPARMRAAIDPAMLATDLADFLVKKGIPFREAHAIAGKAVRLAIEKETQLDQLTMEDWQTLGVTDPAVTQVFDPQQSIENRNTIGGTASDAVKNQLEQAKEIVHRKHR